MSIYRCAECGHGRHLYAWSQAVAYGPVDRDGLLARHDDTDDCFLFVESIQCDRHPSGRIETKVGTRFHVWERCGLCSDEPDGLRKRGYYMGPCPECKGLGGRWVLPASDGSLSDALPALSGAETAGETQ